MHVFRADDYLFGIFQDLHSLQQGEAKAVCMFVSQDKEFVVRAPADGLRQAVSQTFTKNHFLLIHFLSAYLF